MYLANYEGSSGSFQEGCVHLAGFPPPADAEWWSALSKLGGFYESLSGGSCAFRVVLSKQKRLEGAFFALAPSEQERPLRRWLAGFTRLDAIVSHSITLPRSAAEHDSVANGFPRLRCSLTMPAFRLSDAWFACDFRAGLILNDLLEEAVRLGHGLGWQIHIHPLVPSADWLRQAAKNLLRLRRLTGASAVLTGLQEDVVHRLQRSTCVCEEYLAVGSAEEAAWLQRALARNFQKIYGRLGFEIPSFAFSDSEYAEALEPPFHSFLTTEASLDEICGWALDDAARTALLGWKPTESLWRELKPTIESPTAADNIVPGAGAPEPWPGESGYLFLSYKRQDLPRIVPLLLKMKAQDCHFWYDRGLRGGDEWHAMLEHKLECCEKLVFFASQAAIDSKYVRREVLFADTMNKPIIMIKLDAPNLRYGMGMLANQYQMLDVGSPDFWAGFARATSQARSLPAGL